MNDTSTYTFGTASLEIIVLLLGAFLLGAVACKLLKMAGLCCRPRPAEPEQGDDPTAVGLARARARAAAPSPNTGTRMPAPGQGIAYQADLDSLLRGRRDDQASPPLTTQLPPAPSTAPIPATTKASNSFASRTASIKPAPMAKPPASATAHIEMPDDNHVDDLKKLEGIGPRIEKLLNQAGIRSYAKLATMDRDALKAILEAGGSQFKLHEPKSWPYQAELAAKQNWQRLKDYQDFLLSERDR